MRITRSFLSTQKINFMLTELSSEQVVKDFINKMLTDAGMDNISADVREQMSNDLRNRLEDRFFATILASLDNEEKITAFREITEGGNQEKMNQFISENVPNADEVFAQAMLTFRNVYLGLS